MFSSIKKLELCKEGVVELDFYSGIYLHPTDSSVETEDDSGAHFTNVKYNFNQGIFVKDFLNLIFEKEPFVKLGRLMEDASSGDKAAENIVKYVYHEASRKILEEVSEKSGNASLLFLAVGCPEGASLFGGVSTAADVALIIDDVLQGCKANSSGDTEKGSELFKQARRNGLIIFSVIGVRKGVKGLRTIIGKKIVIIL